jgi:hypothetical protein
MKEIYLSGMDSFTNTLIKSTQNSISTSLASGASGSRVVQ